MKDRIARCLAFYASTVDQFVLHLEQNGYPFGAVKVFEGQEYVVYPLYGTVRGDGESYYDGSPLSLMIDASGRVSYIYETAPEGSYHVDDRVPPKRFIMPTTVDEYIQGIPAKRAIDLSNSGDDLLVWSSYLLEQMERFQLHGITEDLWVHHRHESRRRTILEETLADLLADSTTE